MVQGDILRNRFRRPVRDQAPPHPLSVSQRIDRLGSKVHRLQVEYRRFLNGAVEVPPERLHSEIQTELRRLRGENLKGVEENLRLSNLEAKLASYTEMFGRRLREQEEGRRTERQVSERPPDAERGVVVGDEADPEAVETLYRGLQGSGQRPRFDLDSFRTYLERQAEGIRRKTGCAQVVFRIAEEEGKTKLKARPVR